LSSECHRADQFTPAGFAIPLRKEEAALNHPRIYWAWDIAVGLTIRVVCKMDFNRLIQKAWSNGPTKDGKILGGSDQRNLTFAGFTGGEEVRWVNWPKSAAANQTWWGHRIWDS